MVLDSVGAGGLKTPATRLEVGYLVKVLFTLSDFNAISLTGLLLGRSWRWLAISPVIFQSVALTKSRLSHGIKFFFVWDELLLPLHRFKHFYKFAPDLSLWKGR